MTDVLTDRELLERIQHLKCRIAELRERLPYADGQAYYDDKRKIEALNAELWALKSASTEQEAAGHE